MGVSVVNEGSAMFLAVGFKDEVGVAVIPITTDWRIDDITNDVEVTAWTAVAVPAASINIAVPPANNAIAVQTNVFEDRRITIRMNLGLPTRAYDEKQYRVKNLFGAPQ